jgi:hypothetical protein
MPEAVLADPDGIDTFGMPALLPRAAGRREPVTDWRRQVAQLGDAMVRLIQDNAEPEAAYRAAREAAEDVVHAVKYGLVRQFGCTFDSLIDQVELNPLPAVAAHRRKELADLIVEAVRQEPGLSSTELALRLFRNAKDGYQGIINHHCAALIAIRKIERRGAGKPGAPYTYHPRA